MREILNISIGQCGNQIASKVRRESRVSLSDPLFFFGCSFGRSWLMNMAYLLWVFTVEILIYNLNELMFILMKQQVISN